MGHRGALRGLLTTADDTLSVVERSARASIENAKDGGIVLRSKVEQPEDLRRVRNAEMSDLTDARSAGALTSTMESSSHPAPMASW